MFLDEPEPQERRISRREDVGPHQVHDGRAVLLQLGLTETLELSQLVEAGRTSKGDIDQGAVV